MINKKIAFTIVEISIAVFVSAIFFAGVMRVLSSGVKGSTKGMAHNLAMDSATILMAQIEEDLLKAVEITFPPKNEKDETARWSIYSEETGKEAVILYSKNVSDGVDRKIDFGDGKIETHTFAKGHSIDLSFRHFLYASVPDDKEETMALGKKYKLRHGMIIDLTVSNKQNKKVGENESISLKRIVAIRSLVR